MSDSSCVFQCVEEGLLLLPMCAMQDIVSVQSRCKSATSPEYTCIQPHAQPHAPHITNHLPLFFQQLCVHGPDDWSEIPVEH